MVFHSKRKLAQRARFAAKKLDRLRQSTASLLVPTPMVTESSTELRHDLELSVEDELESTVEIDIKQEPLEAEQDDQIMLQPDEVKVEVDLLDPKDTCPAEDELDPFGQAAYQKLFQENGENHQQDQIRCQFCLKQFRAGSGRGAISQSKVEFVLGVRELGIPGTQPACCEDCRKMFELFYEFKRSCLVALERSAELLIRTGAKAKIAKKAKMMKSKSKRPTRSKFNDVQQKKALDGLEEDFNKKSVEVQRPSIEALSTKLKQEPDVEKPNLVCQICMEIFSDGLILKKHWLNHFSTSPNKTVTKPTVSKKSTGPSTAVTEDEQKQTYCDRCRKWFSTKTIYTHHKPFCIKFRVRKKPEPSFLCSLCPQKFRSEQELTFHINKHNGVRTIPCRREGCTKMFYHPSIRHNHEKLCGQEVQEICSICGSIFRSKSSLRIHLATHGDPQFTCEICNKSFYTKANLKKHAAAHSDERKFQCKVCGKRFKSHEANRVHQRIHTEEKPYICHICGQRFTYNCMLKTHLEKGHEFVPAPNAEVFPSNPFGGLGY